MNSKQAKSEPLPDFLGRLGFAPAHVRGNDIWYRSPFRPNERTPSFKIDREKNVWYDHGIGQGGTIIDFVGELHGTADVSRILGLIADILGRPPVAHVVLPPASARPKDAPVIESVSSISDHALEAYLNTRGIPVDLARLYLREVAYRVGSHRFRALGFGNDAGGYEVRSPNFKGSLGAKDITTLSCPGSASSAVFEGFFDFLSILKHYRRDRATGNVLVLNSLALLERGIARLSTQKIDQVHAYLDHDEAGRRGLELLSGRGTWSVTDESPLYTRFKDANDFIV